MEDDAAVAVVVATSAADRRAAGTSVTSSATGIMFVATKDFKPLFVICVATGANAAQVGSSIAAATAAEDIEIIAMVLLMLLVVK